MFLSSEDPNREGERQNEEQTTYDEFRYVRPKGFKVDLAHQTQRSRMVVEDQNVSDRSIIFCSRSASLDVRRSAENRSVYLRRGANHSPS